jgi:hypothetical protein
VGDWLVMAFSPRTIAAKITFQEPVIRFADYQEFKKRLLVPLDLSADINDVLSRQIVDSGEGRTQAKH